eukprot:TRINITY_DN16153_c0_g1_i3.p1 TRINITY_DN16153_c0_g1~~TRINITY_DN16153_c0_g1_i3.p1  ORF type:complete len:188 (-),score=35.29 TRINITY_DN16153_c0_g1_i3:131-694(-)
MDSASDSALEKEMAPIFDFNALTVYIKNTFIEVALPIDRPLPRRRSSSWSVGQTCDVVDVKQLVSFSHRGSGRCALRPCSGGKPEMRGGSVPKQAVQVQVGMLPGLCGDSGEACFSKSDGKVQVRQAKDIQTDSLPVKICEALSPWNSSEQSELEKSEVLLYAGTSQKRYSLCRKIHDEATRPRKNI